MNISFVPEHIFSIGPLAISNSFIVSLIAMLVLIAVGYYSTRRMRMVPGAAQNIIEVVVEYLYNMIAGVTGNDKQTRKFFPIVATIFLFVLISNWLGLIPGVGSIIINETGPEGAIQVPIFRAGSADLNFTLALAIISVLVTQYYGIAALGLTKYSKKFLNFSDPIKFFVGILELIGEVAHLISFSFRLFGNVFAGEVLLLVITFLVPYFVPLPFYLLEVLVGVIQALIFSMLTLVFLKMAITSHEEH